MTAVRPHPRPSALGAVAGKDLRHLTRREIVVELLLPVPWLIVSLLAYQTGWYPLGAMASFFFFLSGLRVVHGAQHYTLGVPRTTQDGVLAVLSGLIWCPLRYRESPATQGRLFLSS